MYTLKELLNKYLDFIMRGRIAEYDNLTAKLTCEITGLEQEIAKLRLAVEEGESVVFELSTQLRETEEAFKQVVAKNTAFAKKALALFKEMD
jgi:hypothetical protein